MQLANKTSNYNPNFVSRSVSPCVNLSVFIAGGKPRGRALRRNVTLLFPFWIKQWQQNDLAVCVWKCLQHLCTGECASVAWVHDCIRHTHMRVCVCVCVHECVCASVCVCCVVCVCVCCVVCVGGCVFVLYVCMWKHQLNSCYLIYPPQFILYSVQKYMYSASHVKKSKQSFKP